MKKLLLILLICASTSLFAYNDGGEYGLDIDEQQGVPKVAIFVNGFNDGTADKMTTTINHFIKMGAKVIITPWNSFYGISHLKKQHDSTFGSGFQGDYKAGTGRFVKELSQYINSLPDGTEIYLLGHSFGGHSVLSFINDGKGSNFANNRDIPRKPLKLVAIMDAVGYGGIRAASGFHIPDYIEYFYNTWQNNNIVHFFSIGDPTSIVPLDFFSSGQIMEFSPGKNRRLSLARTYMKHKDGSMVRTKCSLLEFCADGKKGVRTSHSELPRDEYSQAKIIEAITYVATPEDELNFKVFYNQPAEYYTRKYFGGFGDSFIVEEPKHGTIELVDENNRQNFKYTPTPGYTGSDTFGVIIRSHINTFDQVYMIGKVNVLNNRPPVAKSKTYRTEWNTKSKIGLSYHNIQPAYDPDGHEISLSIIQRPMHGDLKIEGNSFHYSPDFEFIGADEFTYKAIDEYGLERSGKISFDVISPVKKMIVGQSGSSHGSGTIISEPAGISYPNGEVIKDFPEFSEITLIATPNANSILTGWDGAGTSHCGANSTCIVTMSSTRTIRAIFESAPSSHTLTVEKSGDGEGIVQSDMPGIKCGETCFQEYPYGVFNEVTLRAKADENSTFVGWSGACTGKESCIITMNDILHINNDVTATFAPKNPMTFVVSNLDDSGSGSLRQAIQDANQNPGTDTIIFAQELEGTITLSSGKLDITDSLIIEGNGAKRTIIGGGNSSKIFDLNPGTKGTVIINWLTLKDGYDEVNNGGGAIFIKTGDVIINEVYFLNNTVNNLGGGGAIRKSGQASLAIQNSAIIGNSAIDEFEQGSGGGIRIDSGLGKTSITNTTISGNHSAFGGGISVAFDSSLTLVNNTITNNTAAFSGAGLYNDGESILGNNILAGNIAPADKEIQNNGTLKSLGHNIFGENGVSGITTEAKILNSDSIPSGSLQTIIQPLADNGGGIPTHMIVENGLAVNSGDNKLYDSTILTDQRGAGYSRLMKKTIDIGAVERYTPLIMQPNLSLPNTTTVPLNSIEGHPLVATSDNENIASVSIDSYHGSIVVTGKAQGKTTIHCKDIRGNSSSSVIEVTAAPIVENTESNTIDNTPPNSKSGGGSINTWFVLILLGLICTLRRKQLIKNEK